MTFDDGWFHAETAEQHARQAYHELTDRYDEFLTFDRTDRVSRSHFRTLARRSRHCGAPYGVHTVVYRDSDELLLVRHDGVGLWVLPGGCVETDESYREAARRELDEEAGVEVDEDGLAMVTRLTVTDGDREMTGVIPVFAARAETHDPEVSDPDCEISDARWFDGLPEDTRDREHLLAWRREAF